uniref:NADH dehydrogenase subunit 6 n=1 Tax=Sclerodermus sichuanensis TaxID=592144 RepID=UPI0021142980|nr:NADH dehydrogenase subunit 6 [Sclerodermus sichuanensis]UTN43178.1 NADH dehydrogenase subunit 6 [Sclerodermus sichuanensis]
MNMYMYIETMNLILLIYIMLFQSPLSLFMLQLILFTLMISCSITLLMKTSILMVMIFLMMIGGIMILFMFFIYENEPLMIKKSSPMSLYLKFTLLILISYMYNNMNTLSSHFNPNKIMNNFINNLNIYNTQNLNSIFNNYINIFLLSLILLVILMILLINNIKSQNLSMKFLPL